MKLIAGDFMSDILSKAKRALLCMQRYSWEQGVAAQAFMEAGDAEETISLVYDAVNRQNSDGRLGFTWGDNGATDPMSLLEPLFFAAETTGDENLEIAAEKAINWALVDAPRSEKGVVYHVTYAPQFWVDALYMLPPGLLAAGFGEEAVAQADGYIERLYDAKKSLFRAVWDERAKQFVSDKFWGVGNGWAICGLTRMIEKSENNYTRERYIKIVRDTIASALEFQRGDFLFHNHLDEPTSFVECNFAQMLCYAIKKGVRGGWLDKELLDTVPATLDAVLQNLDAHGILHNVCGAPTFDKPGVAPEGQAFFILSRVV